MDACTLACENCSYLQEDMLPVIIDSGFWPGNIARRCQYLFSKKVFNLFDCLHKMLPGTSVNGFLHTLEEVSACNGRVCIVIVYSSLIACSFCLCYSHISHKF